MISGRSAEGVRRALDLLLAELPESRPRLFGTVCDTSELKEVRALAEETVRAFGRIDVWVNNAAVSGPYGEMESIPVASFEEVLKTNVFGYYYGTRLALERMLAQNKGKIINVAGLGSDGRPAPFQTPYASSKAWVQSFTRSVAAEHRGSEVGIFVLNPGMMLTDLVTRVEAASDAGLERLERLPAVLDVLAQPPSVPAKKVVWLASSATDGKTGLVVRVLTPRKLAALGLRGLLRRARGKHVRQPVSISRTQ